MWRGWACNDRVAGGMNPRRSAAARQRRITRALREIERRLGPGVVRRLYAHQPNPGASVVPSGSLGLDLATGVGGFPRGRLTELLGAETSGKTSLLYSTLAATQRQGGLVALVDAEGSADPDALRGCGIELHDLLVVQPASAADALALLTILARCGGLDLLALASLAALRDYPLGVASARLSSPFDEAQRYDLARLVSRWLRVLMAALPGEATAVVLTNDWLPHLPGYRSVGGLALRHYAALRVVAEPLVLLPDGAGGTGGLRVGLTIVKSKVGAPGGRAEVDLRADGVDYAGELLALGLLAELVAHGPLGLSFGAAPLGHSPVAARRRLAGDPVLAEALTAAIVAAHGRPTAA